MAGMYFTTIIFLSVFLASFHLAGSSQKRAVGTSNLKNVISIKKSQKRKIGDVVGSGATGAAVAAVAVDPDERHYCICNAVSYGEMVACDGKVILSFLSVLCIC